MEESIIHTKDSGFDFILDENRKGIINHYDSPVSILLKGGPGCGKSTCALQLAQSYVNEYKTICVYYALEETPEIVEMRLHSFFDDKTTKTILAEQWNDLNQRKDFMEFAKEFGGIIFSKFETEKSKEPDIPGLRRSHLTFNLTTEYLPKQLDSVKKSMKNLDYAPIVIIDSINALTAKNTKDDEVPRRALAELIQIIKEDMKFCSVFVFEEEKSSDIFAVEEYLADVVIEFGLLENMREQRYVRVLKARDHKCSSASNVMEIIDKTGIRVYPDIKKVSQELRLEELITINDTKKEFGINGIDIDLKTMQEKNKGLKSGSTTLLIGEPGSQHLLLGLCFLNNSSLDEKIMLMALEGKEITIDHIGKLVLGDRFKDAYDNDDCHIDVRYILPNKLVNDISEKMHRNPVKGINRLVLSDLRTLFEYHEKEANDIIAYLVDLFSRHGITSVFVYTSPKVKDVIESSTADLFENIIVTQYFEGATSDRRYLSVRVKKYDGISVNRPLHELAYNMDLSPIDVTADRGVFQHLIETQPGKVGFGKLIVRHYSKETPELDKLWDYMKLPMVELFPEAGTDSLDFKPFTFASSPGISDYEAVLESIATGAQQARYPISDILMFDEFWAKGLIEKKRLASITKTDPKFRLDAYLNEAEYHAMLSPVLYDKELYGIPLYGNCSLLVYNKNILAEVRESSDENIKKIIDEEGNIKVDITWENIFDIVSLIKDQEKHKDFMGVDIDIFSGECSSGFLLELLWGMNIVNEEEHLIDWERFLSNEVTNALQNWNTQYITFMQEKPQKIIDNIANVSSISEDQKKMLSNTPAFIFRRMWYTRYLSLKAALKSANSDIELGFLKIPCLGKNNGSISLSGNWYIGVLNGSINMEWAVLLAELLTSYRTNDMIARDPIALPTYQSFWENDLVDNDVALIYSKAKQRSEISSYIYIRPHLSDACCKAILTKSKREGIEPAMTKLSKQIKVINEQRDKGLL